MKLLNNIYFGYHKFKYRKEFKKKKLNDQEKKIFNAGERLIPGMTHDYKELIRHRKSYEYFKKIIENDIRNINELKNKEQITIADLGCDVGHGCQVLSRINKSRVYGYDMSKESIKYAKNHYSKENIKYEQADLVKLISHMQEFDYVVSRGVFEHILGGLDLVMKSNFKFRLIFDVPYNEPKGNEFHLLLGITEKDFSKYSNIELYYQDLGGIFYDDPRKPQKTNMVICIKSNKNIPNVKNYKFKYPLMIWSK